MDSIFLSPLPWQVCPLSRWVRSLDGLGPIVFAVLPLLLFLFSVGCLLVELVGIQVYVGVDLGVVEGFRRQYEFGRGYRMLVSTAGC